MKSICKLLALLLAVTLGLTALPVLAEEGSAPITVTFDLNTTHDLTDDETYIYNASLFTDGTKHGSELQKAVRYVQFACIQY